MIAGHLTIEDISINFRVIFEPAMRVEYTAADGMTGASETVNCDARAFMIALGIALNFNGEIPSADTAYADAISVQPVNETLRFIP